MEVVGVVVVVGNGINLNKPKQGKRNKQFFIFGMCVFIGPKGKFPQQQLHPNLLLYRKLLFLFFCGQTKREEHSRLCYIRDDEKIKREFYKHIFGYFFLCNIPNDPCCIFALPFIFSVYPPRKYIKIYIYINVCFRAIGVFHIYLSYVCT